MITWASSVLFNAKLLLKLKKKIDSKMLLNTEYYYLDRELYCCNSFFGRKAL